MQNFQPTSDTPTSQIPVDSSTQGITGQEDPTPTDSARLLVAEAAEGIVALEVAEAGTLVSLFTLLTCHWFQKWHS